MSVNVLLGDDEYNAVTLMVNGRNDAPTGVSAEFLWEHHDNGIVTANIIYDGADITIQIYDEDTNAWRSPPPHARQCSPPTQTAPSRHPTARTSSSSTATHTGPSRRIPSTTHGGEAHELLHHHR